MPATEAAKIDQPWIALNQVCKIGLSRNQLAAGLLMQILFALDDFERHGLEPFRERWLLWDSYMNSEVVLRLGERKIRGIVRGIDQHGALLIEQQGQIQRYYSGEISLRPR
jgi:BirA family biotin operon repressor/biotin-[acetyl-CoA-carboxylase] ligase